MLWFHLTHCFTIRLLSLITIGIVVQSVLRCGALVWALYDIQHPWPLPARSILPCPNTTSKNVSRRSDVSLITGTVWPQLKTTALQQWYSVFVEESLQESLWSLEKLQEQFHSPHSKRITLLNTVETGEGNHSYPNSGNTHILELTDLFTN